MHPLKIGWAVRAIIYKLTFGKIGNFTYVGKPCFIEGQRNIYIGNRVRIFPGIRMEAIGSGKIIIGDNVAIEQNVQINSMNSNLIIGDGVTIAGHVFITNEDHKYEDITKSVMEQGNIIAETAIGDGCFIGYGTVILQGTILGKHCVVGSNAVLKGVYSDYSVIVGVPGKIIKKINLKESV